MALIDYSKIQFNPIICMPGLCASVGNWEQYVKEQEINEENMKKDPRYGQWAKEAEIHYAEFKRRQQLRERYERTLWFKIISKVNTITQRIMGAWRVLLHGYEDN